MIDILRFFLSGWLVVSSIVFIWWFYDTRTRDLYFRRHEKLAMFVFIGALFALVIVLRLGLEELLNFIPDSLGSYDEYGEFETARSWIANILALGLSFFVAHLYYKSDIRREENRRLRNSAEIREGKMSLRNLDRDLLISKRDEMQNRLEKLQARFDLQGLSTEEEEESQVLDELLTEAEERLLKIDKTD